MSKVKHIGIIMDGNGRWAQKRGLPRPVGHREGAKATHNVIESAINYGLTHLTLYVFSAENWKRPKDEVSLLMKLLVEMVKKEITNLIEQNVKVVVLGDLDFLPTKARDSITEAIKKTENNTGLVLQLALSYGGRLEIVRAAKEFAKECVENKANIEDLTEESFKNYLYNPVSPDPELIIRTGGEERLSNFLLWQSAYSEFYFTDVLWPDFSEKDFLDSIEEFNRRERRFGKVLS